MSPDTAEPDVDLARARALFARLADARLAPEARAWRAEAAAEIAAGAPDARFAALFSGASRRARAVPLAPAAAELAAAEALAPGWSPERWTVRAAARASLVLARADLADDGGRAAVEDLFRHADEGELVALYGLLALLPGAERYVWRAGEGCRTNMRSVFEAAALDTPYPARWFDDVAFRQCAIKCVFVGAPLWRLYGLDARLSPELARMALDLADERTSAGRPVQHELWLCLGPNGGERALAALARELESGAPAGRAAAAYALARAGRADELARRAGAERDARVRDHARRALAGEHDQRRFRELEELARP